MPSNFLIFDRIRALAKANRIYQAERTYQDQYALDRLSTGGEFLDTNVQATILDQTNLQINRMERYRDYEQMDQTGEISLALDLYADEGSLVDPERKHTIVIRARNRRLKRELEDLLFNTLLWDVYCRPSIRYLCKYGDLPFEVIPDANRGGVVSLRFMNVYNFTRIETKFGDLVGFYYQDALNPSPQFMHPWQVMHLRLTSFENIFHPYGKCCDLNSYVDTPTGHKKLRDVRPGDWVMSWNGHAASPTKVLAAVTSGVKETLNIRTKHRQIRITPEHPVLVVVKDNYIDTKFGPKRDISTKQWVLAKNLKIGDKLVLPRYDCPGMGGGCQVPLLADKSVTDGMHDGHRLSFPEYVNDNFAKLMGFLIGDGWTSANEKILYFAEGEYQDINRKYIDIVKSYGYDREPSRNDGENSQYGSFQFSSAELTRTVKAMGLVGLCWEKRVPEWVFTADPKIQLAFVEGLVDSDGSINVDKWGCERFQFESTSECLVRDLKHLLDRMGYKCGNVGKRNRQDATVTINGKICERRESWIVYWYDSKMPTGDIEHSGCRRTRYKHNSSTYLLETVLTISDGGVIEVGDIQVENNANFVCGGVVVHNSILDGGRKAFKQLRLMEDAALIYRITRAPEKRKFTIPVGMIPPKEVPEYMQMIGRQWKRQRFYNPTTGSFDERYSPLIQEDDFFLPRRPDGSGPDIDTLPGAENLDQIADIEYFKKKVIAPTKIPFARVGIGEGAGEASEKSLSQSHSEFAKAVQWVQREVAKGLTKVAIIHLALRGYSVEDLKGFEISLSATSAMEELYRIETWQTRASVMAELKGLGWFAKEWIVTRFTDLSPDEIEELKDMEETDAQGGPGGGIPGGLDIEPDMGAEPGGDMPDLGDGEENAPIEQAMEGFDWAAERRLLLEMHKQNRKKETKRIVESWAKRLGRDYWIDDNRLSNGFEHLLETKELDGLSSSKPISNGIHNPNNDAGLLVEWSVEQKYRDEAISETYVALVDEPEHEIESGEITENDLPNYRVSSL